jgi:NADPH-dependent F420 reductase
LDAGSDVVSGADNVECAARADVVLVTVPWEGHDALLESLRGPLAGKIVVDCVNPLGFDERGPYPLQVTDGSAAQRAAALLPDSRVIAAFHHVSAVILADLSITQVDCDVLVLGDDRAAVDQVRALADAIPGVRGVYGGRLRNAGQVEALAANLIAVNRRYRTHAGIRLTGVHP